MRDSSLHVFLFLFVFLKFHYIFLNHSADSTKLLKSCVCPHIGLIDLSPHPLGLSLALEDSLFSLTSH
uniref:Uncharacterized protein n=1 Tax=Physcomitrium patens TaxID=3218 RepID=A0A2K1KKN3_PHYPA|nr:hypothetical protein PHYPA_008009 [Physcomitrium patens]